MRARVRCLRAAGAPAAGAVGRCSEGAEGSCRGHHRHGRGDTAGQEARHGAGHARLYWQGGAGWGEIEWGEVGWGEIEWGEVERSGVGCV